jgi:phosphoglycolate phosphatase
MNKSTIEFKAVLFDLDGTFADTAPDLAFALNEVLASQGKPPLPYDIIRPWVSKGAPGLIKLGFNLTTSDRDYHPLRERFLAVYQRRICKDTRLFPGIAEFIDRLDSLTIPWGIITNKPEFLTTPLLRALQLAHRSHVSYSGDSFIEKKPHPLPLLKAAETIHVNPADCLYIGDDERDMIAARAAGMIPVAALWGYIPQGEDPMSWDADLYLQSSTQLNELWVG